MRKHFAHLLGVSRTSWYARTTKQKLKDKAAVKQFTATHMQHPFYVVYRLALHLRWKLSLRHANELIHEALTDALSRYSSPAILHSGQGSKYLCYKH